MKKSTSSSEPSYITKIKLLAKLGVFPRGDAYSVEVYHEDACQHWRGRSCNCDADVRVKPRPGSTN